jgi:hypothetical protein
MPARALAASQTEKSGYGKLTICAKRRNRLVITGYDFKHCVQSRPSKVRHALNRTNRFDDIVAASGPTQDIPN